MFGNGNNIFTKSVVTDKNYSCRFHIKKWNFNIFATEMIGKNSISIKSQIWPVMHSILLQESEMGGSKKVMLKHVQWLIAE